MKNTSMSGIGVGGYWNMAIRIWQIIDSKVELCKSCVLKNMHKITLLKVGALTEEKHCIIRQ